MTVKLNKKETENFFEDMLNIPPPIKPGAPTFFETMRAVQRLVIAQTLLDEMEERRKEREKKQVKYLLVGGKIVSAIVLIIGLEALWRIM